MNDNKTFVTCFVMGAIALVAIVATITWGVDRGVTRDKEFAVQCLEAGGTIIYSQCVTGVEPRE